MRYFITLLAVLAFTAGTALAVCPGSDDSGVLPMDKLDWHGAQISRDNCTSLDVTFSWFDQGGNQTVVKAYIMDGAVERYSKTIDSDLTRGGAGSDSQEEIAISNTPIQGHIVKISGDTAFRDLRLQYNTY